MDTNRHQAEGSVLHRDFVFRIAGWASDVVKEAGHGLHEKSCGNAWVHNLRITGLRLGLIINFKRAKLEWERAEL